MSIVAVGIVSCVTLNKFLQPLLSKHDVSPDLSEAELAGAAQPAQRFARLA
jgi:hypothetical protein